MTFEPMTFKECVALFRLSLIWTAVLLPTFAITVPSDQWEIALVTITAGVILCAVAYRAEPILRRVDAFIGSGIGGQTREAGPQAPTE